MDEGLIVAVELNENIWDRFAQALENVTEEEIHWRPLPQANSINMIVRHLRIEAAWHLRCLERDEPMPTIAVAPSQEEIDAVEFDFEENYAELAAAYQRFRHVLTAMTLEALRRRTEVAYGEAGRQSGKNHLLAYHQATHLAVHLGQIRMIRNLYRTTRGEPRRFFPENPMFPR